jgi:hypothetical protein
VVMDLEIDVGCFGSPASASHVSVCVCVRLSIGCVPCFAVLHSVLVGV